MRYAPSICALLYASWLCAQEGPRPHLLKSIPLLGEAVHDARFTADGKYFATASSREEVLLRETDTGQAVQWFVLRSHYGKRAQIRNLFVDEELGVAWLGSRKYFFIANGRELMREKKDGKYIKNLVKAKHDAALPQDITQVVQEADIRAQHQDLIRFIPSPKGDAAVLLLEGDRGLLWRNGKTTALDDHARWPRKVTFSADSEYLAFRDRHQVCIHSVKTDLSHQVELRDLRALIATGKTGPDIVVAGSQGIRTLNCALGKVVTEFDIGDIAGLTAIEGGRFETCSPSANRFIYMAGLDAALIDLDAAFTELLPRINRSTHVQDWVWQNEQEVIRVAQYNGRRLHHYIPGFDHFKGDRLQSLTQHTIDWSICRASKTQHPGRLLVGGTIWSDGNKPSCILDLSSREVISTIDHAGGVFVGRLTNDRALFVDYQDWAIISLLDREAKAEGSSRRWIHHAAVSPNGRRFALARVGGIDVYELR